MIKFFKSKYNDDTGANGGIINVVPQQISDGAIDNIFPSVMEDEREEELTRYRKIFGQYYVLTPEVMVNTLGFVKLQPSNDDIVYMSLGSTSDTQADVVGGSTSADYVWHGSGILAEALTGGTSTSIFVYTDREGGFNNDDTIFIGELGAFGYVTPYFEVMTITSAGYSETSGGYLLTGLLNATSGDTVRRSFSDPENTVVASCVEIGSLTAEAYDLVNSSVSAGLNQLPTVNNIGAINGEFEITALDDDGNIEVSIPLGALQETREYNISEEISVTNYQNGYPYFVIPTDYWFGDLLTGDTVVFKTSAPLFSLWLKQTVPASAAAYYGVTGVISIIGE